MAKVRRVHGEELDDLILTGLDSINNAGTDLAGVRRMAVGAADEDVVASATDVRNAVARLCRRGEIEVRGRGPRGTLRYGPACDLTIISVKGG